MSPPKKLAIRFAIYLILIVYLFFDLLVWKGPFSKAIVGPQIDSEEAIAEAKAMGIAARVYFQPIYRTQIETRMHENLWKRDRTLAETTASERRLLREVALHQLIDELLMKIQIKISPTSTYSVSDAEQEKAFQDFQNRFATSEDLNALTSNQGWNGGEKEIRLRLNGRLERENYLKSYLRSPVSDEDVKAWYDEHTEHYSAPERRQVRQIFISTHAHDPEEARKKIESARSRILEKKEDFQKVSASIPENIAPSESIWMTAERLPSDLSLALFSQAPEKLTLFKTKLGIHLAEVLDTEPEAIAPFEEVKESIRSTIADYRKDAAYKYFHRLMRLRAEGKIEIFEDMLYIEDPS